MPTERAGAVGAPAQYHRRELSPTGPYGRYKSRGPGSLSVTPGRQRHAASRRASRRRRARLWDPGVTAETSLQHCHAEGAEEWPQRHSAVVLLVAGVVSAAIGMLVHV